MTDEALTIYVLDDDAGVREALGRLMRASGFQVRTCASEEELVAAADPDRPGCVLFDLGVALSEPLAARVAMPLIALTGGFEDEAETEARRRGADFLLHKPADARALMDAIRWVTRKPANH